MISYLNILDERNISILISGDVLEVFDQNNNLIGEKTLTVYIEENTSEDEIYSIFEENGLDLKELCDEILSEAVIIERIYDFWITDESVIFYSPKSQEFVAEPLEGIFAKMVQAYDEIVESELSEDGEETFETEGNSSEFIDEETELLDESTSSHTYKENTEDVSEVYEHYEEVGQHGVHSETEEQEVVSVREHSQNSQNPMFEEDIDDLRNAIPNRDNPFRPEDQTPTNPKSETNRKTSQQERNEEVRSTTQEGRGNSTQRREETSRTSSEGREVERTTTPQGSKERTGNIQSEEKELINSWKNEYLVSLKNNHRVKGVTMGQLRDKVVEIVLDSGKEPFEIEEKEILFRLATEMEAVFDTQTAVRAGLYQAYLILKG